jgi:PhnB protein
MTVQPYLYFNGRCEEAFEFYRRSLGAEKTSFFPSDEYGYW